MEHTIEKVITMAHNVNLTKEEKKQFAYINAAHWEYLDKVVSKNYKTKRGFFAACERENARLEKKANRRNVKYLEISINWKPSRVWGLNPHAEAIATYDNGITARFSSSCSGCGYDKESTVLADIFNAAMSGMLWRKRNSRKPEPYGIYNKGFSFPFVDGGIGTNCFLDITKWLGGTFKKTANGKTFSGFSVEF